MVVVGFPFAASHRSFIALDDRSFRTALAVGE